MTEVPKWMSIAFAEGALAAMGFMESTGVRARLASDQGIVADTLHCVVGVLQECLLYTLTDKPDPAFRALLVEKLRKLLECQKPTATDEAAK